MSEQKKSVFQEDVAMLGNLRVLVAAALLAAMSLILGKFLQIPNPVSNIFRISLENLPVILAGVCFGPWVGGMVGAVADLVGCMLYGYAINPVITLGAASAGLVSGLVSHYLVKRPQWLSLALATIARPVFSAPSAAGASGVTAASGAAAASSVGQVQSS